jgi:hypothetical protein
MSLSGRLVLTLLAALLLPQSPARADDAGEYLTFAWESFWQQSGYPRAVSKWRDPIRVRFTGASAERYKAFALRQLTEVAEVARLTITEVSPDDATANMQVEFVGAAEALPDNQPCQAQVTSRNGAIQRVRIQANESVVWRCMMHEAMHAMGVPGHPMAKSVLTYFARAGRLGDIDKRLLRQLYSDEIEPNMSPFAALAVIARRDGADAKASTALLLRKIVADMEQFGNGAGEPPAVVLRSSKVTVAGLARGQHEIQFFLGLAYLNGHIVERDHAKAVEWLTKAAAASHVQARRLLDKVTTARAPADVASSADAIRTQ